MKVLILLGVFTPAHDGYIIHTAHTIDSVLGKDKISENPLKAAAADQTKTVE